MEKNFKFMEFTIHSHERVDETMICFIKIQSENLMMTWNLRSFIFCKICNFFKCDGFTICK